MPGIQNLSDYALRQTVPSLLSRRILSAIATNTTFLTFNREINKMRFIPGEPPKGTSLSTPSCYVWCIRKSPSINSQGSLVFTDWEFIIRIGIKSSSRLEALDVDTSGHWTNPFEKNKKTPLEEAYALEDIVTTIFETDGYDHNWYYSFVQNGVLGERNRIRWDYTSYGGIETGIDLTMFLTGYFTVRTWSDSAWPIAKGKLTITISGGVLPAGGGVITIKDKYGNYIEDVNGKANWVPDTGVPPTSITTDYIIAQDTVTVYYVQGAESGSTSANIVNNATTAVTVSVS